MKHHHESGPSKQIWVFGIIERNETEQASIGYMEIVERRDSATLLPIIQKVVRPGSIVHSDEWRAYRSLQGIDYAHETVNHSVNFVDAITGVHTQTVESYWNKHKYMIKMMKGCRRDMFNRYLSA